MSPSRRGLVSFAQRARARLGGALHWGFPLAALSLLLFSLVLRGLLVETLGIHWDEYNFLSKAYLLSRGELTQALQAFHAHLFSWLASPGGNEVDQVIVARRVMFAFSVVMAAGMGYVGHRLLGGSAGIFAAFVFGSFWYVQHHGASFRYDAIIAPLFICTVALLITKPNRYWPAALAGFTGGLSLVVSLKTAMYFPAFAIITALPLWVEQDRRRVFLRGGLFIASGFLSSGLLFLWHRSTLMRVPTSSVEHAERAYDTMIDLAEPFQRQTALIESLRWDTPMWALLLCGVGVVVGGILYERGRARARFVSVLALATPMLSLYFYRNAWPYFYVTMLPGACLLAGAAWRVVEQRAGRRPLLALVAALVMAAPVARTGWLWYANNNDDETAVHRDIVAGVHEIFPEQVPYVDRCAMVASFPKAGSFMTSWAMEQYRARGEPIMADLLRSQQPKLLINNTSMLDLHKRRPRGKHALTHADFATLKDNFVLHWGSLWVAGKQLKATPGDGQKFRMLIAGVYTYEGGGHIEIDGRELAPFDTIELAQGEHRARALGADDVSFVLRYGDHLKKPDRRPARANPLFRGFKSKRPKEKWKDVFDFGGEGSDAPEEDASDGDEDALDEGDDDDE